MSISMWSYPWDLEDCGMAYALDDMKAHGIDGVSMITSYHAGRFLCIRSPKRKIYFPEDGVAYYPCDMKKIRASAYSAPAGAVQPGTSRLLAEAF